MEAFIVGLIFGAFVPVAFYLGALKRIKELEKIITFYADGEELVQREAKTIKSKS